MSGLVDTWKTPHEQYGGMLCFLVLLHLKSWSPVTSTVSDSAATKFTPETPKVELIFNLPLILRSHQTQWKCSRFVLCDNLCFLALLV